MDINTSELELLKRMVDKNSLQSIIEALSYICSERAIQMATELHDTASAKGWMLQSVDLDRVVAKWERKNP